MEEYKKIVRSIIAATGYSHYHCDHNWHCSVHMNMVQVQLFPDAFNCMWFQNSYVEHPEQIYLLK